MATNITQIDDPLTGQSTLRVDGELLADDAILIKRLAVQLSSPGNPVRLDLADIDLIDSDAGSILRELERNGHLVIDGVEIFLQHAIDAAERH